MNVSLASELVFLLVVILAGVIFLHALPEPKKITASVLGFWVLMQSGLAFSGFYQDTQSFPPRMGLAILPAILLIAGLFIHPKGRTYLSSLNLKTLLLLHALRIPVEWCLFDLFHQGYVPQIMTFEGRNFDIVSGILALVLWLWQFRNGGISRSIQIAFNVLGLALLLNIMVLGILSTPTEFQQFGFEQPNEAVLVYPFVLLPALVVPLVLLSHLTALWRLFRADRKTGNRA